MLNVKAFGLSAGILWGAAMLIFALVNMGMEWAPEFFTLLAGIYPGYEASFLGAVIGAIWGFLDAGIGGAVFAWLYNKLAK